MAKGGRDSGMGGKHAVSKLATENQPLESEPQEGLVPVQLQQHVLNIFRDALSLQGRDTELETTIQKVKGHLFDRNFASAFGSEENLLAYAARWSSYRALGYLQILVDIAPFLSDRTITEGQNRTTPEDLPANVSTSQCDKVDVGRFIGTEGLDEAAANLALNETTTQGISDTVTADRPPGYDFDKTVPAYDNPPAYGVNSGTHGTNEVTSKSSLTITSVGGGAGAEVVASAAWLRLQSELDAEADSPGVPFGQAPIDECSLEVQCIDMANWSIVHERLTKAIEHSPTISKYASAAAQAANLPLLPPNAMRTEFVQQDMLEASADITRALFQKSDLITIMFTLNELYSSSVSKTQRLLFEITVAASPGALLLVVDSPGSYSTVRLNNTEKKYPMQWLLDHTLLEAAKNTRTLPRGNQWEKLLTEESRWFRPPKGLRYPIELENMRYQIHLYRRLAVSDDPSRPEPSISKPHR